MEHFLERLAKALLARHGGELERVAVVLPGRRAGIHLRKYLAAGAGHALWSPELYDPSSFAARITDLRQGASLELLFHLHAVHATLEGARAETLSEVLLWAPAALRDMSEVDAHLLDHDQFYRDLRLYQEIGEWSLTNAELSPGQARTVHQWERTRKLHALFNQRIAAEGLGTTGLIARRAVEMVKDPGWRSPWTAIWFAGLNALEPASLALVQQLVTLGLAQVAWDADLFYLDDPDNQAGHFLRRSIKKLGQGALVIPAQITADARMIQDIHVPDRIAQVYWAAEKLHGLSLEERSRTTVVLADESLLLPLLGALPSGIGPMNVTMGVPLSALPAHGMIEGLLHLHETMAGDAIAVEDIERLFGHPMLHARGSQREALKNAGSPGSIRLRHARIAEVLGDREKELAMALAPIAAVGELHDRIQHLIGWAVAHVRNDRLATEQLYQLAKLEQRLAHALRSLGAGALDVRSYRAVRERILRNERIPLFGEPITGLQVMGLLETRSIDHERVIILGADEESLSARPLQSWIPYDVRRHNHLPLRADTEAIASYHAHRLLHSARELCLVHASGGEELAEPTRLIAQWAHSLVPVSDTRMEKLIVQAPTSAPSSVMIAVQKSPTILDQLAAMSTKGFTPSQLGTWLRCPLDFHFTHILGIRDEDIDHGKLGSDVLGTAVHAVLEEVFAAHLGKPIPPADLRERIGQVPVQLRAQLRKAVREEALDEGHHKLSMEMAAQAVGTYIEREADRCGLQRTVPLAVEARLSAVLPKGDRLRGTSDRLEERDGLLHVLDLKTGAARPEQLKLDGLEREHLTGGKRYALQLLAYACMAFQSDPALRELRAGIIPLRKPSSSEGIWLKIGGSDVIARDQLTGIEALLQQLINELRDPATAFTHDPDSEWCRICVP